MIFWSIVVLFVAILFFGVDVLVRRMYAYESPSPSKTPADYGIPYEKVRIPAPRGGSLAGWWIPGEEGAPTLILVHGWSRNAQRMMPYIRALHPLGYNLLAFDARNHGDSSPYPRPTVYSFAEDALSAVHFVQGEKPQAARQLGIIGLSIGGGGAVNAAAMDGNIACVVAVGAVAHPIWTMLPEFRKRGIPEGIARALFKFMEWRYGLNFERIAPVNNIASARAHFLLIHGEEDKTIPLEHGKRMYAAAPAGQAELWVVPGKGHSNCHTHPDFWPRVTAFLEAHCASSPAGK